MSDRYAGKPFLQLVDAYVLDAIGHLDLRNQQVLSEMEPRVRAAYKVEGTWRQIVEQRMGFPPGMPNAIRQVWQAGIAKFEAANGEPPDPVAFAYHFVDKNFPH